MKTISVERLREVLNYDPETGIFTRRIAPSKSNMRFCGVVAGTTEPSGYTIIRVDRCAFKAHRFAVAYVEGEFPPAQVDHINGDRSDNRYANLRKATHAENHQNRTLDVRNKSGFVGVFFNKKLQKWLAHIRLNRVGTHLGCFDTPEEAHAAYLAAKAQLHTFQPTPR